MSASKKGLGSDLAKVDAYENGPDDYVEIPELSEADFARGAVEVNGASVKRGRPAPNGAKQQVTLRLDPDLLASMRSTGAGWQGRVNEELREAFINRMKTETGIPTYEERKRMRSIDRKDRSAKLAIVLERGRK